MTVAYLGPPGTFSHEAALAFLSDHEPTPQPSFAAVIASIVEGRTERGILPLANSIAGPVEEVRALLAGSTLRILSRHELPVRLHLLGKPGSSLAAIRSVLSHPVALRQCATSLGSLGLETAPAASTAAAARDLSDPTRAALASEAAARAYGLIVLRRDLQDRDDNATSFGILARS